MVSPDWQQLGESGLVSRSSCRDHVDHPVGRQEVLSPVPSLQDSNLRIQAPRWVAVKDGLGEGGRAGPRSGTFDADLQAAVSRGHNSPWLL